MPSENRPELEEVVLWKMKTNNFPIEAFKSLHLDEKTADVHFICGADGERIPAHKCILSKASPVFDAMFYGKNATTHDKEYPETSPNAFKDFLKLCYSNEFVLSSSHIIEVMKLAHEFQMFESLKLCGELWADNMTIDDVCCAYHWAIHLEMDELRAFCERKIGAHAKHVFETSHFLSCDREILNHILDLETLSCDEKFVLQACLNWASKVCERDGLYANDTGNCRLYLKDMLYKIRYSGITMTDLGKILDSTGGVFTNAEDYEDVIRLITKIGELKTGRFNPNPRSSKIPWNANRAIEWNVFNRLDQYSKQIWHDHQLSMEIRSSRPILLGGFHWAPLDSQQDSSKVTVTIQQKSSTPVILHTADIELKSKIEPCIDLTNSPILLQPAFDYQILFKFDLGESNCSNYYPSKIDNEITFNEETTVVTSPPGHNIVRGFKFNVL